jgi:hypothetical protein
VPAASPALVSFQCGAPTITRKLPSVFGVKLTFTVSESTTEAVTPRPPAVSAASEPKVCPEPVVAALSVHVSASVATLPDAAATGERPDHRLTVAVCAVFGLAPVTSTTNSSLSARA